jgi:aspartate carbamoyltransferase catalytic subunit
VMYVATDEASTRTTGAIIKAARNLKIDYYYRDNIEETTSLAKGEDFTSMIRTLTQQEYLAFAFRSRHLGFAAMAASVDLLPIVNLGNADDDHPTQWLGDAKVLYNHFGRLNGLRVVLAGDNRHGRVNRAVSKGLSAFSDNHIIYASPHYGLNMKSDVQELLIKRGTKVDTVTTLPEAMDFEPHAVILSRRQTERFENEVNPHTDRTWTAKEIQEVRASYENIHLSAEIMDANPDTLFGHPQPSGPEFAEELFSHPQAIADEQVHEGVWMRTAGLLWLTKIVSFADEQAA